VQWGLKHYWDALLDADLECDALGWQYVSGCMAGEEGGQGETGDQGGAGLRPGRAGLGWIGLCLGWVGKMGR